MIRLALIAGLVSSACSPITRARGRCPTFAPLLTDFVIGGVGLGVSVDRFNAGDTELAAITFAGAMLVGLAANMSECR